jgi:hypothetical protein
MNALNTPKNKLLAASAVLALLLVMASMNGLSASGVARAALAVAAIGGIAAWWLKAQKAAPKKFQLAPRMSVVSRTGLSQRTGLALVEVDGRAFLVVHGDGYAEICPTRPKAVRQSLATNSHRTGGER